MLRRMKYTVIPRIVPADDVYRKLHPSIWPQRHRRKFHPPVSADRKCKLSPFVASICGEMVTSNHLIKIVPFLLANAFITGAH